jgi:hypothetical protein
LIVDNAFANLRISFEVRRGGDTGRRRAEHRNFLQLRFTHQIVSYRSRLIINQKSFAVGGCFGQGQSHRPRKDLKYL